MTTPQTSALHLARQRDSEEKKARVDGALAAMLREGKAISIAALATAADVSRQFIYSKPDLVQAIEAARQTQRRVGISVRATAATVTAVGLKADLLHAREEITRLRAENQQLRHQFRADLGARVEAAEAADLTATLAAKQAQLTAAERRADQSERRAAALEQQVIALNEQIAAERATNAQLGAALAARGDNVVPLR